MIVVIIIIIIIVIIIIIIIEHVFPKALSFLYYTDVSYHYRNVIALVKYHILCLI